MGIFSKGFNHYCQKHKPTVMNSLNWHSQISWKWVIVCMFYFQERHFYVVSYTLVSNFILTVCFVSKTHCLDLDLYDYNRSRLYCWWFQVELEFCWIKSISTLAFPKNWIGNSEGQLKRKWLFLITDMMITSF